jgi:hypothetical protein
MTLRISYPLPRQVIIIHNLKAEDRHENVETCPNTAPEILEAMSMELQTYLC